MKRMSGMEHWLPLLEERLEKIFDHLGDNDLIVRESAVDQALQQRHDAISDYHENRVRGMPPALTIGAKGRKRVLGPRSETGQ